MEERKRLAIMGEDYDSAKSIKAEIDRIKDSAINNKGASNAADQVQFPSIVGGASNR